MKNWGKRLSLLMVLLSMWTSGAAGAERDEDFAVWSEVPVLSDPKAAEQQVEIIVLLEEETSLDEAVRRGVSLRELPENVIRSAEEKSGRKREEMMNRISEAGIPIRYRFHYDRVVSGFSAVLTEEGAREIAKMPGVLAVQRNRRYQKPKPLPMTGSSIGMIGADILQGVGYKGEGRVIAILDSGFDLSHEAFRLDEGVKIRLLPGDVSALGLPGDYRSEKIPYAYDYADQDKDTAEWGSKSHGMHVAGIAAANSAEEGGIRGVAPNAQILAMKVFSDFFGDAPEDALIRAVDDAVLLGADVINLSLGVDAAIEKEEEFEPLKLALERAEDAGVFVAAAAGNAGFYGDSDRGLYPRKEQPDYGVIASPALHRQVLAVAAVENTYINGLDAMRVEDEGRSFALPYQRAGNLPVTTGRVFSIEFCGLGRREDLQERDLTGKAALIERGEIFFSEKVANAESRGAEIVLIFNHEEGGDRFVGMAGLEKAGIPVLSLFRSDGLRLMKKEGLRLRFIEGDKINAVNPVGGRPVDFSSWGAAPDLRLKPDLSAPGGNIDSLDTGGRQRMSGTSMAAPHASGAAALLLESRKELLGRNKPAMIRNILMSTAAPVFTENGPAVSPRKQGAGMIDLAAALNTPAVVYDPKTREAKIELGDQMDRGSFSLELFNFSDASVSYEIRMEAAMDSVAEGSFRPDQPVSLASEIEFSYPSFVTAAPFEKKEIRISYDASQLIAAHRESLPYGFFAEGFIILEDRDEVGPKPSLSIPFLGFCGDWEKGRILDYSNYEEAEGIGRPFYGDFTRLYTTVTYNEREGESKQGLGSSYDGKTYARDRIAISPDGDKNGDEASFAATFLRHARRMKIEIEDEEGRVIAVPYELPPFSHIHKNFYGGDDKNKKFYERRSWSWDGKDRSGSSVKDGKYAYVVRLRRSDEAEEQVMRLPIKVDTVPPKILGLTEEGDRAQVRVEEDFSGIREYRLILDTRETLSNARGIFEGVDFTKKRSYLVIDHAHNITRLDREGTPLLPPAEKKEEEKQETGSKPEEQGASDEREFERAAEGQDIPPALTKAKEKERIEESKSSSKEFIDVESSHWAWEAIDAVTEKGWFSGYPDGSFRPKNTISRAEAAMVLVKVFDLKAADRAVTFSDVPEDAWYAESVKTLSSLGIMSGFPDNRFRPQAKVDREQMMVLLVKAVEKSGKTLEGKELNFTDADSVSAWARAYVEKAQANGLVSGFEDGSFRPKAEVSRAELAMMLYRQMKMEKQNER